MRVCSLCNKKTRVGRNRSHAQNRSPRLFKANVQKVTLAMGDESKISGYFCTKCIKKLRSQVETETKTASK